MKKDFELTIHVIRKSDGECVDIEHRTIEVPSDTEKHNFMRMFINLRDQHPDLYHKWGSIDHEDYDFIIDEVLDLGVKK